MCGIHMLHTIRDSRCLLPTQNQKDFSLFLLFYFAIMNAVIELVPPHILDVAAASLSAIRARMGHYSSPPVLAAGWGVGMSSFQMLQDPSGSMQISISNPLECHST